MPPLTSGTTLGPYQVTAKIGQGGMGEVYSARDTRLDRIVAIKILPPHVAADPELKQRFEREAKTISSLNHPNICTLYDVGRAIPQDPHPGPLPEGEGVAGDATSRLPEAAQPSLVDFLVMEYLEGETLAARIAREPLPLAYAVQHMLVLLATLEVLHCHDLVHRDLKPANLILTPNGLKLLDFGLARPVKGSTEETGMDLTQGAAMLGTPRYMAPEAVRGETTDGRADLFAVGAMLYEMLSGTPPFDGPSVVEIAHAVLHETPPVLTGSAAIVTTDRVIHRALAKRAEDRYQDAAAMARDLRGVLSAADAAAPVEAHQVPRLIVLPFRMLRPDEDTEFLAFSLPEAITMSLSGLESIVVRSTLAGGQFATESPDLKALASHAEVDLVLVGSLLRGGDTLQVNAQLLEAPGGTVVWSERTKVGWQDIFRLQEDLTRRIVGSLAQPLSAKEEQRLGRDVPLSAAAYELYLRANRLANIHLSEFASARDLYLQCVDQDPQYAPAWARLGRAQKVMAKMLSSSLAEVEQGYAEAERSFERALSLNPDLGVAHSELAALEIENGRAREAMIRILVRIDADGGNAALFAGLVRPCRYCGLLGASLAAHQHARRLDPNVNTAGLVTLLFMRRYEEALAVASVVDGADVYQTDRVESLMRLGRDADAVAALDQIDSRPLGGPVGRFYGFVRAVANRDPNDPNVNAALADADVWKDPEAHYVYAYYLGRLGDGERALAFLARAVEGGFSCGPAIAQDPWFDPLRRDPEFIRLLDLAQTRHREAAAAFTAAGGERLLGL